MKHACPSLVTLIALAAGCQVGEVTEVAEPVAIPIVLGGFDDGGEGERLVGELTGDQLRLSPDLTAALGESYALRLAAGGVNVALDPADPVVTLSPRLEPGEPIRLILTDDAGEVATLELRLGDPDEAAEHDEDLVYYHTCASGSGTWSVYDDRWAAGTCGECGAGKRRWRRQVTLCHHCPQDWASTSVCTIVQYSEYCDYC